MILFLGRKIAAPQVVTSLLAILLQRLFFSLGWDDFTGLKTRFNRTQTASKKISQLTFLAQLKSSYTH